MGSGSSVVVRQPHVADARFKQLLSSKDARKTLFEDISAFQTDDHMSLKGKISLKKLVGYFTDESHALYPGFDVNVDILSEAVKYTLKSAAVKSKKKKQQVAEQLSLKDFHKFFPVLLLFDRLWDLFDAADKVVIEDKRIFKGEFVGIYDKLCTLSDVVVLGDLSKDEWAAEFAVLDKNNDGYVNFNEFCGYCVNKIQRPFDFNEAEEANDSDAEEENSPGLVILQQGTPSTSTSTGETTALGDETLAEDGNDEAGAGDGEKAAEEVAAE